MNTHVRPPQLAAPALGLMLIACALPAFAGMPASAGAAATADLLAATSPPAEAAPPAKAGLTREQLARLLDVVDKRGTRAKIPPAVASMLQFESGQVAPDIKEAAFLDEGGVKHGFAPLNDHSGFFLFRSTPAFGQSVFHVDSKLQLVRAARSFMKGRMVELPRDEGEKELREEFDRWSKTLSPGAAGVRPPDLPVSPFNKGAKL